VRTPPFVIAGLDPAIHPLGGLFAKMMDARVKPARDKFRPAFAVYGG